MAKIWRVSEGREPTSGEPWLELPLQEAASLFGLQPEDFVSDPAITPRFGNVDAALWYTGYKHIVVEVTRNEGRKTQWKPGFYRSRIKVEEAGRRLIKHAVKAALGDKNVVDVELAPTTDSQGRNALKITVVIAPDATRKLKSGAALDALVQLQERLRQMREDRTPIIQYTTEAELALDGGR